MPKKILVVEDDHGVREVMKLCLEEFGFEVTVAEHGKDALRILKEDPLPRLILLDLQMPEMDGFTFLRHKGQDSRISPIPVVVISSLAMDIKSLPGVSTICPKPFVIETLVKTCKKFCA